MMRVGPSSARLGALLPVAETTAAMCPGDRLLINLYYNEVWAKTPL